jgi:hypothetical protein
MFVIMKHYNQIPIYWAGVRRGYVYERGEAMEFVSQRKAEAHLVNCKRRGHLDFLSPFRVSRVADQRQQSLFL